MTPFANVMTYVLSTKMPYVLISILNINVSRLCYHTNYDSSTIFRIRNGKRQPSDPVNFASDVAGYVAKELADASTLPIISELTGCTHDELNTTHEIGNVVKKWLLAKHNNNSKSIKDFLTKLNDFDLNEYINTIHFNDLKVPTVPFQLPGSRFCTGLNDMMNVELDFLKATVLSKSTEPVYMYSDMPMEEMADFIRDNNIEIMALTIPKTSANEVARMAVEAGIKGIWNFAHMDLIVPSDVVVENVHLSESLMTLSYNMNTR